MIVIPMAGLSSRFARAGYDRPKWMLPLAGRPLLDWSLLSFAGRFDREPFLIVHLDAPEVAPFVRDRLDRLGVRDARLVALDAPTAGQAHTVELGLEHAAVSDDEPLTIFNIDTIRPGFGPGPQLAALDGWLECFEGEGDHWSFVRPHPTRPGRASQVTEKVRVSALCSDGLYAFRSAGLFREALALERAAPSAGELYVAPLYQHLIDRGREIGFTVVEPGDLFFSGTPEEYEALRTSEPALLAAFADVLGELE